MFPSDPNLSTLLHYLVSCEAYKSAALHRRNTMGRIIMEAPVLSNSALYYQRFKFLNVRTPFTAGDILMARVKKDLGRPLPQSRHK